MKSIIDFTKVFDHVQLELLLRKFEYYGISSQTRSFLHKYTQNVSVNGTLSDESSVTSGFAEGSVLGHVLFSYILKTFLTTSLPTYASSLMTLLYTVKLYLKMIIIFCKLTLINLCHGLRPWQMDVTKCYLIATTTKDNSSNNNNNNIIIIIIIIIIIPYSMINQTLPKNYFCIELPLC